MKMRKIFCIFILLVILPANNAMAQKKKALILLDHFRQTASLTYQYNGQTSESGKSEALLRENLFSEAYRFDIDYGVYDPRLLKGHLAAELKLDQDMFSNNVSSGSSTGHHFLYNLNGVFFGRHPYPVNFFANSATAQVQRTFSGSFNLATDSYGAGSFLKNNYLPLQFNYSRNKSMTSGLANNREQVLENFSLLAKHKVRDFSYTEAELSYFSSNTDTKGNTAISESFLTNDFSVNNQLTWASDGNGRSLSTSLRFRQEGGDRDSSTLDFGEALTWDFGKAFKAGARYSNSHQKTGTQEKQEDTGDVWLRHILFQNLRSAVQLQGRSTDFPSGKEREIAGSFSVDYQKILPTEGLFQLTFSQLYGVLDRNLADTKLFIEGERISSSFFADIQLKNSDIVPGTIVVRSLDESITYLVDVDYTVEQRGRLTFLIISFDGSIPEGVTLLVDYEVDIKPSIKYATNVRNINGLLLLYGRRLRIFAGLDDYDQETLSGRADPTNLIKHRTYRGGLEITGKELTLRAEYTNHDSTTSVYQSVDGSLRYRKDFDVSSLTLQVKDRITFRENPAATVTEIIVPGIITKTTTINETETENVFVLGADYRRTLLRVAKVKLAAEYLNKSGLNRRDALSLGMAFQARLGKMIAELKSNVSWLMTSLSKRRDDTVRLEITRYF